MNLKKTLALVVLYFIVWLILGLSIVLIYNWYSYNILDSRISFAQEADVMLLSKVISAILVLAYIFRKKLFGKKE